MHGETGGVRPDSIRQFLDAGGNVTELEHIGALAEDIIICRAEVGDDQLRRLYAEALEGAPCRHEVRWRSSSSTTTS